QGHLSPRHDRDAQPADARRRADDAGAQRLAADGRRRLRIDDGQRHQDVGLGPDVRAAVSRRAACAGALVAALAAAAPSTSAAQPTPAQELDPDWLGKTTPEQIQESGDSQLRFLAFFFTRMEISNIAAQNDLLSGRVGGRLFGSNTTTTSDAKSFLAEQRFVPFFQLEPRLLNH